MNLNNISKGQLIGVAGAGSFGTAVANLIAENHEVLLYVRREEVLENVVNKRENLGQKIHPKIQATTDLEELTQKCKLIFPTIPSASCNEFFEQCSPFLKADHILIHGTKGFNVKWPEEEPAEEAKTLSRENVQTISELILEKTVVLRVGCVSGPNLSSELAAHQPAGTVVASHFNEVIELGQLALRSDRFQVYGSHDLIGVELAGALKNVIAIASGALSGLGYGENIRALLVSKGLGELIRIGTRLGGDVQAFLGLAGIGDIMATASSSTSRNFTVGFRLAKGETLEHILATSEEVAEGINTVRISKLLADNYKIHTPIVDVLYGVLFQDMSVKEGLQYLMKFPFYQDVDFL